MEPVVNLREPYPDIVRRFNTELFLSVVIAEYGDLDIAIEDDGFVLFPGEYEHPVSPCSVIQ